VIIATVALFGGQYLLTGNAAFLLLATGVAFLALFGYLNGAETDKARGKMTAPATSRPTNGSLNGYRLPQPVDQLRTFLHRRRIRLNLVSGVEFESALFVIAPVAAAVAGPVAVLWVAAVAGGLLICFELALMARFWRAARAFDRSGAGRLPSPTGAPEVAPREPRARAGTGGPPTPA
jgi:hypothetical protein